VIDDRRSVRNRIDRVLKRLVRPAIYGERIPLVSVAHHVHGEPISPSEARSRDYVPFAVGDPWGGAWDTTWFRMGASIPSAWHGSEVVALIDLGGTGMVGFTAEGLVWDGDQPLQGCTSDTANTSWRGPAQGGEAIELWVEAAANPIPPWVRRRGRCSCPTSRSCDIPPRAGPTSRSFRRDVEALYFDMLVLVQLLDTLADDGPRAPHVLRALTAACDVIEEDDVPGSVSAPARELRTELENRTGADAHRTSAIGHAHIDSAWLWPTRETKRKCARTFANALRLMQDYPEYRFSASQAQQYTWMKDHYPPLYERMREQVQAGRFERSEVCGSRPTATSRQASRWYARSCTANASSSTSSTSKRPTCGSPTCSDTRLRSRRSSKRPASRRFSPEDVVERHEPVSAQHLLVGRDRRNTDPHALPARGHLQRRHERR